MRPDSGRGVSPIRGWDVKVCLEPGCPKLTRRTRCPMHERGKDRARGTRQQRGYDAQHDALGAQYQARMDAGERFDCWRCGNPLGTRRNIDWQLGHDDLDRTRYRGPECPGCNQATSGRR